MKISEYLLVYGNITEREQEIKLAQMYFEEGDYLRVYKVRDEFICLKQEPNEVNKLKQTKYWVMDRFGKILSNKKSENTI